MRKTARILFALTVFLVLSATVASAGAMFSSHDDVTTGAQLYDKWYAALGVEAPEGNHPIWERQTTNSRSGADTWRCSECHGWDYKGSEGAYAAGSHYTGFPNVMKLAAQMPPEEIVGHLKGSKDPSHDFSAYMDDASLQKLAIFLKEGVIDDAEFIDTVTLKVKNGDPARGKQLFDATCAACHGADGKTIAFRSEGVNEYIGNVATRDPYRFLHRTRFGVAGTEMPAGRELGWSPEDGRDVLAYAQTLSAGEAGEPVANAGAGSDPAPQVGGPANSTGAGILTGFAAFLGTFGVSAFFLFGLVVIGFLVVWALRKRQ